MIITVEGNILGSGADALVNPVNCKGVWGAGLALQFKTQYPQAYMSHRTAAKAGAIQIGDIHVSPVGDGQTPPYYLFNFPTKRHWTDKSRLQDIRAGLESLSEICEDMSVNSVAIPALGCGLGGLRWESVSREIYDVMDMIDVITLLYVPK